jgi:hypothetical protein
MTIRKTLTKINNAIRPPHVEGTESTYDPLGDARAARAGRNEAPLGMNPPQPPVPVEVVHSQQEERPK